MANLSRQTAYKTWISSLNNGNYKIEESTGYGYVEFNNTKISRVNLIGTVVNHFISEDSNYGTITIDDNSSTIRIKSFREDTNAIKKVKIGDLVLVIGRIRKYNDEIYINHEIIKALNNPNWELLRKLELLKLYGKPKTEQVIEITENIEIKKVEPFKIVQQQLIQEESIEEEFIDDVTENSRQKVLTIIERYNEEGANINNIIQESNLDKKEIELAIQELLKEGEIYESRPGILRSIS
jgi:RPA family protein